jgi:two-component system sensor histidine kinase QseC
MSIRYILIIRILIASFVLVGIGAWLSYKDVQHETRELFDAQLARSARLILSLVQADPEQINLSSIQKFLDENQLEAPESSPDNLLGEGEEEFDSGHIYEAKLGFQIWDSLGNLILKSANVPLKVISQQDKGYSNNIFLDNEWRVFTLNSVDGLYRAMTAERVDVRNDLIGKVLSDLLFLFVILVAALSITSWFAISQGLSSLRNLTAQIHERGAERLDSISEENAPIEIQTITGALNQLLSKLQNALAREKRITSDAAHELRTPLAAVKLHAELASRATNKEDRKKAIADILLGNERTTHLVNQLLALARLEPDSSSLEFIPHDLCQIVREEVALLAPSAQTKEIDLSVCESEKIIANVDDTSIRLLIRNLLTNAISYTQRGGKVRAKLSESDRQCHLVIEDNGPGIPLGERDRVFERFYRIKSHGTPGCGIGLSIVMRVAELHQASLSLDDSSFKSGLKVTIILPIDRSGNK